MSMSIEPTHEIGDRVYWWAADDPKNCARGTIIDLTRGESLCTYEEDTGNDYDEADDACGWEHDDWYVKVRLENGEVLDWENEYFWRKVKA